jgi:hypothetical protein
MWALVAVAVAVIIGREAQRARQAHRRVTRIATARMLLSIAALLIVVLLVA